MLHQAKTFSKPAVVALDVGVAQDIVETSRQVDSQKEVVPNLTLQDHDDCLAKGCSDSLHRSDEIATVLLEICYSGVEWRVGLAVVECSSQVHGRSVVNVHKLCFERFAARHGDDASGRSRSSRAGGSVKNDAQSGCASAL